MNLRIIGATIYLMSLLSGVCCGEPLHVASAVIGASLVSAGVMLKDKLYCYYAECCSAPWVQFNYTELKTSLQSRVYGQPMLYRLAEAINEHWNNKQPSKALVVAMHGPTGTGKNYAVRILADHLFGKGSRSRFYHFFSATVHFPHSHLIDTYADQIHEWVRGNVTQCSQSVFVFDEIDKMPHSLLDRLKPFVDYHEHINNIDYRQAIFIFLSNSGSELIMKRMQQLYYDAKKREDLNPAEFDDILSSHSFTDPSCGLKNSLLLRHHLISRFVPFLPLERQHVIGCVKDYLNGTREMDIDSEETNSLIKKVLEQLTFIPKELGLFSSAGCKRIVDKTLMVLNEI